METVARGSDGRRLFTAEFKRAQIDRILKGEVTAAELSRELGVARSLIQRWKYLASKGAEAAVGSNGDVVPVGDLRAAQGSVGKHPSPGMSRKEVIHERACAGDHGVNSQRVSGTLRQTLLEQLPSLIRNHREATMAGHHEGAVLRGFDAFDFCGCVVSN